MRRWLPAVAVLAIAGCSPDPDPFPFGITSLAVLPAEAVATDQLTGRMVGQHLTQSLQDHTLFRVVGSDSTGRILAQPDGYELFHRFRTMAMTQRTVDGAVARAMGDRLGVQGLMYPRLALALNGPVSGQLSLTVTVYEASGGQRVWQGYGQRSFAGHPGEPAFNRTVGQVVEDIVARMPRPAGEEDK